MNKRQSFESANEITIQQGEKKITVGNATCVVWNNITGVNFDGKRVNSTKADHAIYIRYVLLGDMGFNVGKIELYDGEKKVDEYEIINP